MIQPRRGPLRRRSATLPDGVEVLECGHRIVPPTREVKAKCLERHSRRCPECEYDCGARRAAYEREYRKRNRKAAA